MLQGKKSLVEKNGTRIILMDSIFIVFCSKHLSEKVNDNLKIAYLTLLIVICVSLAHSC